MAKTAVEHSPAAAGSDLRAVLTASGVIGTWFWSAPSGHCILDEGAARILAGDAALAGATLRPELAHARVITADRPRVARRFRLACRLGGPFSVEYRTLSADGVGRTILERGRIFLDDTGQTTYGHGIVIDATEPTLPCFSLVPASGNGRGETLDAAASHAIACRRAIERLAHSELRLLVDLLLTRLGQEIAGQEVSSRGGIRAP